MADITMLSRPIMTTGEAARQLRIPAPTLRHWLEGGVRGSRRYQPILRPSSTGDTTMTWGEIVEARYLRAYRTRVPMQRLRPFIDELRQTFQVPYPLAHFRPFIDANRRLVLNLQERTDLPDALWLVFEGRHGQAVLNPLVQAEFLDRVEFATGDDDEAVAIVPMGSDSPVRIDPRIKSGAATVSGVRTEAIVERLNAGQTLADIATEFSLTERAVRAAVSYEFDVA